MSNYWDAHWLEERYQAMYYHIHGHMESEPCPDNCPGREVKEES